MRRLWTTAAAAALCVFAADAWGAPYGGRLELVATHHHAKASSASEKKSAHRKGRTHEGSSSSGSRHSRRTRHGLRGEAADEEPVHARGRRGRHHAEEAAPEERHARRGRHQAAEASDEAAVRGRRGRHARAASEIRSEGRATVEVGRRDSLESISKDTGVSVGELARLNHLKKPYRIRKGEELKLPERRYYVVKGGDTVFSLARKFGVDSSDLLQANDLSHGRSLRAGQKLYLPGAAHETAAPVEEEEAPPPPKPVRRTPQASPPPQRYSPPSIAPTIPAPSQRPYVTPGQPYAPVGAPTAPPSSPSVSSPPTNVQPPTAASQGFELSQPAPARAQPYQPVPTAPSRPIIQSGPAPSASDVATAGKGRFIWPLTGQVIQGFGPKADGQRNDGLNITAASGDPVRASADGEVVYAGDQVPSFGNLVLVKHPGGWVTAYAHMGRIQVKNRDQVVQGQQIGIVGQTGQVDRPQLHFEIRYAPSPKDKATPVDPALVLPTR